MAASAWDGSDGYPAGVSTDLWMGVTASSLQAEGVAPAADWSAWERDGRAPVSGDGAGFGIDYAADLRLFAELGLTHVGVTVEWARIEPEPGTVDSDAVDHYLDVLRDARHAGLAALVTLHHGTLPGWFSEDARGYRDERSRDYFWLRHVDRCAETFDGLAAGWIPIADPVGWAVRGFLLGSRPPGRRDPEAAAEAVEGALEAVHLAAAHLRAGDAPVIGVFGAPTLFEVGPDARPEVDRWDELLWGTWIRTLSDGLLAVPGRPARERPELVDGFDVVGIVHDHPVGVDRTGALRAYPTDGRRSDAGFCPIAEELGVALRRVAAALDVPLLVAGHGVATADDDWRDEILADTVRHLDLVVEEGIDLRGYLHDTGIDGYEGVLGFSTQRGIVDRDRNPKPSSGRLRA